MSNEAAAQAATPAKAPVAHDPLFINTPHGAVAVYGHELVSKKDILILGHCLTRPCFGPEEGDHGVRMIMFRDDNRPVEMVETEGEDDKKGIMPRPLMAACIPDAQAVVMNLQQIFTVAVGESIDDPTTSVRAAYHRNLILDYLHEIHHMSVLHTTGMPTDPEQLADLEEQAEKWALMELMDMAKTLDIEPSHHAESSFLADSTMELLKEEDDDWSKSQRHMLENNIMYELPEGEGHGALTLMSFKGLCHMMSGDDPDSDEWKVAIDGADTSEMEQAIKGVDTDDTPVELPPETAAPTTMGNADDSEAVNIPDPGIETAEGLDPNMMAMGGMGFDYGDMEDVPSAAQPAPSPTPMADNVAASFGVPSPAAAPAAPAAPTNGAFPVAGQPAPAPTAPPANPQPGFAQATATTPNVAVYPKTGLTPEQTRDVVFGVFNKIYNHIFTNCGRMLNSDIGFQNPEAVTIPIQLTEQEKAVVVKMDCLDENGRWCPNMPTVNGVRGFISKNTKLPTYKLYINNDGHEAVRLLLPQNPATGSKPALQARGGSCIMYVMDGMDKAPGAKSTFYFKCIDSNWQAC